jgi:excisionase family DNA binding protein
MAVRYFTIKEAAGRLRVSHDTVSRLIERGDLPAIRVSERLYRIPAPALERYESGTSATVRRVVRVQVGEGITFGVGETEPGAKTTPPRPRNARRTAVKTA